MLGQGRFWVPPHSWARQASANVVATLISAFALFASAQPSSPKLDSAQQDAGEPSHVLTAPADSNPSPTQQAPTQSVAKGAAATPQTQGNTAFSSQEERVERALEVWKMGLQARSAGDLSSAFSLLEEAFGLAPRYDVAISLAELAQLLGKEPEAARYLSYALEQLPLSQHEVASRLSAQLKDVRKNVAELHLTSRDTPLTVTLDGRSHRTRPFLAPGAHIVRVSAPGRGAIEFKINVDPGDVFEDEVSLPRLAGTIGPANSDGFRDSGPSSESPRKTWVLWAGGGLGLALAGAAFYLDQGVRAEVKHKPTGSASRCYQPAPSDADYCSDLARKVETTKGRLLVAQGLAVASGVAVLGTALTYWFWREPPNVALSVGSDAVSAAWTQSF